MSLELQALEKHLVSKSVIDMDTALAALTLAKTTNKSVVEILSTNPAVNETLLCGAIADYFKIPVYDWSKFNEFLIPKNLVDESLIYDNHILPVEYAENDKILSLVVSNPSEKNIKRAIEIIKVNLNLRVNVFIAGFNKIADIIDSNFSLHKSEKVSQDQLLESVGGVTDIDNRADMDEDDQPIITKFVNQTLREAIRKRASDLHFEPFEDVFRIRFRIDGILLVLEEMPIRLAQRIIARIKVSARMDIGESRLPQDGRIRYKYSERASFDFRVNSLPTAYGEKIVMRILDSSSAKMGVDALGFEPDQKQYYLDALSKPQGMILITGPTGSGKTVSLYTGLNILNQPELNICTVEDPIEINLRGINQVAINAKSGLDFASVLRSFLRQDPDVIMVGEIRDLETAEITIKASQTGHLVLSTLHTNSAPETLTRLRNMGIPSFNIATSVRLVIAQRLARRLCSHCKTKSVINEHALYEIGFTEEDLTGDASVYEPVGCSACGNSGYKGRVGIYEVVPITKEISALIMDDANALEIEKKTKELGFNNLRRSGILKILAGHTSIQEVMRVTSD